jgi:DNA-binding NtrC family response regulator
MERVHFAAQVHGRGDITAQLLNLPACKTEDGQGLLLKDAVRGHIAKALERFGGNRQKAAEALGISERYLYKLLSDKGGEQPESGADGSGTSVQVP